MDLIQILRKHIRVEITGNWKLYLESLVDTLPVFAASGHSLYTKCIRIFVQHMMSLQSSNPTLFNSFALGDFVLRRSDRFWAGLSPDLLIEQVLIQSLKTSGGLTRGRGLTDTQQRCGLCLDLFAPASMYLCRL